MKWAIFLNLIFFSRAMALSISLMFGRLGACAGSSIVAHLLYTHCESTFYLSGSTLLGNYLILFSHYELSNFKNCLFFFTVMGILAFFIPNIHKKTPKIKQKQRKERDQRYSVVSFRGSVQSL